MGDSPGLPPRLPQPEELRRIERRFQLKLWSQRFYVLVMTIALTVILGARLERKLLTTHQAPNTHPDNQGAALAKTGLTEEEAKLALAVRQDASIGDPRHLRVLFLGNSETIVVVGAKPGDLNTPQWFQVYLSRSVDASVRRTRVHSGALPGMNIAEMLIALVAACENRPPQANVAIVGISPEVLRKLGVRDELAEVAQTEQVRHALEKLFAVEPKFADARAVLASVAARPPDSSPEESAISWPDRVETRLESYADRWKVFQEREGEQTNLAFDFIQWRNRLFHISTDKPRPIPRATYETNLQIVKLLVRYATDSGTHLVFYLMPLRGGIPNPYPPAVRNAVRTDLGEICRTSHLVCLDYMDLGF